jgi:hypothetical protein
MTSAWSEPTGQDDRTDGQVAGSQGAGSQFAGPDENQLDMFEMLSRASNARGRPSAAGSDGDARVRKVEVISPLSATRDFLAVGGPDSDELRRLEESIRWLMNAGNMRHLPPATTLSPVSSLPAVDTERDDSLILDPETLFTPRVQHRPGDIIRGATRILLVSAIAAPTAYFAASWIQFPGPAMSADPAVVSTSVPVPAGGPLGVQVAALEPMAASPAPEATRSIEDVAKASPPPPQQVAIAPAEKAPDMVRGVVGSAELKVAPPEQPSSVAAASADSRQTARGEAEAAAPAPIPVAAPPKPAMRPEEITLMIERGRTLFDAGDLAAARLFFRRAANAGDASAAIAMGATYDPEVLGQRFIRGIEADAREAQKWYDKARALGGTRVEMLAHR